MYGALDISVSGLIAQRTRLEVASANVAKIDSPVDPSADPTPWRRAFALVSPETRRAAGGAVELGGVRVDSIALDASPFRKVYDIDHPLAAKTTDPAKDQVAGYVNYPDIDGATELMNAYEASRLYEANLAAAEATKTMLAQALQIIA